MANQIEPLQQNILWSGLGDESKFHPVNKTQICAPVSAGDLAITNLRHFNEALLGK